MRRLGRWLAPFVHAAGLIAFAGIVCAIMMTGDPPLGVELGEPAPRDFVARAPFRRMNIERTRAVRERARLATPPVFRYVPHQWQGSVDDLLAALAEGADADFWQSLPEDVDRQGFMQLLPPLASRSEEIEQGLALLGQGRITLPEDLARPLVSEKTTETILLRDANGGEARVSRSELMPLDAGDERFADALAPAVAGIPEARADAVRRAFAALLEPNAPLDAESTTEDARAAAAAQPEVTEAVSEGRLLLARGSEVTRQHLDDLAAERRQYEASGPGRLLWAQRLGGLAVLLLVIFGGGALYARRYRPDLLSGNTHVAAFVSLTLATVGLARMCVVWGLSPLYVPVPLLVMVMCLVYDQRFGIGVALFFALLVRLACPGADAESFTLLLGGVVTALFTDQIRTRSALIITGLLAGATQFCAVWGLGLISALDGSLVPLRFWQSSLMPESVIALVNGVACGFIVSGLLPAIEVVFGITTDIRLLEWSDPNQPLLQRLLLDAPGSYHHSMIVGSLAADAAEAVGANPLLARVSAYFHDAGKLKKPQYFAENLPAGAPNPHDDLSPTMSSLIITAHPKDGADMAEEYGVPRVVRDVILQSHGSSLVKYFWRKAQEMDSDRDQADERSFRYRLPKPDGKEAAIVMICDAVESAARSLDDPSVGQLRNLVHDLTMDRLHDGQLDDSQLTITDLKRLEDCLVRGLTAVFHSRVAYPGQEKAERAAEPARRPPERVEAAAEPAAVTAGPPEAEQGADGD
jgi:putative nucleotidyltransferase with HDIG domain